MQKKIKLFAALHFIILLYSLGNVFSKTAASKEFLSFEFCFNYGMVILLLAIYALLWQQILKGLPLNLAFANKSVTVIWGMIWGSLFFNEQITPNMIIGSIIVLAGIVIVITGGDKTGEQ